ncbi:hypothetical protein MFIFM68171_09677 [Madurella fahalii]|uniref:Uncharacterized protein n=1 Tax=Madurella fahalii TaxID=1157608 RepID=A0ABQ0GP17_9PEZI
MKFSEYLARLAVPFLFASSIQATPLPKATSASGATVAVVDTATGTVDQVGETDKNEMGGILELIPKTKRDESSSKLSARSPQELEQHIIALSELVIEAPKPVVEEVKSGLEGVLDFISQVQG